MEPVIGLTTEEQCQREEDPNLTLDELLGFSSCKNHISTPLQTLDGLYVNQPSHFLPLAQKAKRLAKKIKAEEEALQWSGIPVEQLLNNFHQATQLYPIFTTNSSSSCSKGLLT